MNKLTKELIYNIAIQGKDKSHWTKVLEVFGSKESRTPWKDWVDNQFVTTIRGGPGLPTMVHVLRGTRASPGRTSPNLIYTIIVTRDYKFKEDKVNVALRNTEIQKGDRFAVPILGFTLKGPMEGPDMQNKDWIPEMQQLCSRLIKLPYNFYIWNKNEKPWAGNEDVALLKGPQDLEAYLAQVKPNTLQLAARTILESGLDFCLEPLLGVLEICQRLGISINHSS